MAIGYLRTREGSLGRLYGSVDILLASNLDFRNQLAAHRANEVDRLAGLSIDVLIDEGIRLATRQDHSKSHVHLVVDEEASLYGETWLKLGSHSTAKGLMGGLGERKSQAFRGGSYIMRSTWVACSDYSGIGSFETRDPESAGYDPSTRVGRGYSIIHHPCEIHVTHDDMARGIRNSSWKKLS